MSYQIRCTWAGQHTMILRCSVWCFGKHSDVDPILDRKIILRWSCSDGFEKRAPEPDFDGPEPDFDGPEPDFDGPEPEPDFDEP